MPDLQRRLEEAAKRNGATLSREIEQRLSLSFDHEQKTAAKFGSDFTYLFCRVLSVAIADVERETGNRWSDSPFTFEQAELAATELFQYFRPKGPTSIPENHPLIIKFQAMSAAEGFLESLTKELKKFQQGKLSAKVALALIETSLKQDSPDYLEKFRAIAGSIRPRLEAAGTLGKAQRDLMSLDPNDPQWLVRG